MIIIESCQKLQEQLVSSCYRLITHISPIHLKPAQVQIFNIPLSAFVKNWTIVFVDQQNSINKMKAFALLLVIAASSYAQTTLRADANADTYQQLRSFLGSDNAIEVPDCAHSQAHITHGNDGILNRHVFYFHSHVNQDNDRCMNYDRQRTEITTYQSKFYGGHGETVSNSWNMKLDANFQWSNTWSDLHQLKAVGGNEKQPIITLQAINNKFQVSHMNGASVTTKLGTADLQPFLGNWVHIVQEVTYWTGGGHYYIHVSRLDNGQALLHVDKSNVEMWRPDNSFVRPKWGIYRSLNDKQALRDETVRFDSFCFAKGSAKCT